MELSRKVRMGASLITALTMGVIGVMFSSTSTRAQVNYSCDVRTTQTLISITAVGSYFGCSLVQVRAQCTGDVGWRYGEIGRVSEVRCPGLTRLTVGQLVLAQK